MLTFKLFLSATLFVIVFCEENQISEKQERNLYDVRRLVRDIAENVEALSRIDEMGDSIISNNLHSKSLNAVSLVSALMEELTNDSRCYDDLNYIKDGIDFKKDSWGLKMLDSFGKPESGILEGNVKWLGNFDECRSVYAPKKDGGYYGQYCTLGITLMKYMPLSIGVCLPDTCNPSDFKQIFNNPNLIPALNQTGIDLNVTSLTCKAKSLKMSNAGIATLCIMSLFVLFVLMGSSITAYKYFSDTNTEEDACRSSIDFVSEFGKILEEPPSKLRAFITKCDPFLNCFCVFTNGSKLLNTDSTEGQLLCLHGIRFLSMTWVIMCHSYIASVNVVRSLRESMHLVDNLPFQAVLNGWYSVDSFFVLSGFLMAYLYFQERAKRQGKTPWLYFYVHRYLRLTPVYMLVLAFYATVMPLMGSGPIWTDSNVDEGCRKGWWSNLIYMNNILQDPKEGNQCMGWSWYLANDMQFFVISPLFLITLWRWPKVGFSTLLLFLWGCWISGFLITYQNNLLAGAISDVKRIAMDSTFIVRWNNYMQIIYVKPYTRIAPYIIGIALGYILFKMKEKKTKLNWTALMIGWSLAVPAGLYCVYGIYDQTPTLVAASFYNAIIRTVYGLSLSWLILVCLLGQGGIVDGILSFKLFLPLSRLTYCAYLIHPIFQTVYITSLKSTIIFSHQTAVLMYLGLLIVTYAFSFLVSLTFESPIIRLEKLVRNAFKSA